MQNSHVIFASSGESFLLKKASCTLTLSSNSNHGDPNTDLGIVRDTDILIQNGIVLDIRFDISPDHLPPNTRILDARKWVVMPGLVDAHVHPIFAGNRAAETVMKAQGLSYEEIAARGGGIRVTANATRAASDDELQENFLRHAQNALQRGVVLMDAKTGYGLSSSEELRHIRCLVEACAKEPHRPAIAATLLGPHSASPDFSDFDRFLDSLVANLPEMARMSQEAIKKGLLVSASSDIFVERNYFSKEHGRRWLNAALEHNLDVHIHADEFSRSGGAELAFELAQKQGQKPPRAQKNGRVLSIDHCQFASESDLRQLATVGVVATALPCTSFISGIPYVEASKWRSSGVSVAIASDFNPGSAPINNLWLACYLALTKCGFSMTEVIRGVTRNAAMAVGAEDIFGSIVIGKPANLIAFEGSKPEDFFASPVGDHLRLVMRSLTTSTL
jgi:imidazolonepropionase